MASAAAYPLLRKPAAMPLIVKWMPVTTSSSSGSALRLSRCLHHHSPALGPRWGGDPGGAVDVNRMLPLAEKSSAMRAETNAWLLQGKLHQTPQHIAGQSSHQLRGTREPALPGGRIQQLRSEFGRNRASSS